MILTCVIGSLLAVVLCDDIIARFELRRLKLTAAETVAVALGNSVLVDGIELPKPDDSRWATVEQSTSVRVDGVETHVEKTYVLHIGDVKVSDKFIWVGESTVNMYVTSSTKNYCSAVWKVYRSRVSRKSIENAT